MSTTNNDCAFPASAQNLPLELLHKIFYYCLPPYSNRRPSRTLAPLSLCRVSRKRRNTARNVKDLWERLLLRQDPSQDLATNRHKFVAASALWLERRKHRPIDLQFDFDFGAWSNNTYRGVPAIRDLVFPIATNARDFSLEVNMDTQLEDWLTERTTGLEALEAFSISVTERLAGMRAPLPVLLHAHKLRLLSLSMYGNALRDPARLPIPWAQITHLSLPHQMPFEGWHRVIRACLQLQHCYVGFEDIGDDLDDAQAASMHTAELVPVNLLQLQSLAVGFYGDAFSPAIFAAIVCPRLESLAIVSEDFDAGFLAAQQPLDFYLRSASTLQSLTLTRQKILAQDVIPILRVAVGLRDLDLDCMGNHDPLLLAMEIKGPSSDGDVDVDHEKLVPLLQTFSLRIGGLSFAYEDISGERIPTLSAQPYVAAVISRWLHAGSPFAWAQLFVDEPHRGVREQVKDMVRDYRSQGFDLRTKVIGKITGGEVASVREDAWARWRLDCRLISV
ncbi:hypothetical protein DXG01_008068 [Tephrocybe rancida]|nr:hypothetical protein DXG01_008068 [Tephrocybe rancida]